MSCLLTEMRRSAVYSRTICGVGSFCGLDSASSGRLMSTPFCVSGSAAMKMTSSTSSTSISGVTFMSALTFGASPTTTASAPWCLCA